MSTIKANAIENVAGTTRVGVDQIGVGAFKNKLINGGFDIWQRGTSFPSNVSTYGYAADRVFYNSYNNKSTVKVDRPMTYRDIAGRGMCIPLRFVTDGTETSTPYLDYRMEENDWQKVAGKEVTYSFGMLHGSAGSADIYLEVYAYYDSADTNGVLINTSNITFNGSENKVASWTFTIPETLTGKTLGANAKLRFILKKTNRTVASSMYFGFRQLELGSVATPFEQRPIGMELSLCQRYLQAYGGNSTHERVAGVFCRSSTQARINIPLKPNMRTTPTISLSNASHWAIENTSSHTATSLSVDQPSPRSASVNINTTGLVSGGGGQLMANSTLSARIFIDAEL